MGDLSNKSRHLRPEVPERGGSGARGPHGRRPAASRSQHRLHGETREELWNGLRALFLLLSHLVWGLRGEGKARRMLG